MGPAPCANRPVTHLTYGIDTLKACSLSCSSWYAVAVPPLHYTIILRGDVSDINRNKLKPVSKLHELGLMPLVREQPRHMRGWFRSVGRGCPRIQWVCSPEFIAWL